MKCLQELEREGRIQGYIIYPIVGGREIRRMGMFQKEPPGIMLVMLE